MVQRFSGALWRAVHHVRSSGSSSIPTRTLGLLASHGIPRGLAVNAISTSRKTHGSIQQFRLNSSSASQSDIPKRRSTPVLRIVNNLDPRRLLKSDIIDLSGPGRPRVKFGTATDTGSQLTYYWGSTATPHKQVYNPFPPGRGFFYFRSRPGLPVGTGEIRFRLVEADSPSDSATDLFARGRDLLEHRGHMPWRLHMLQIYTFKIYRPLRSLLLQQGLISQAQIRDAGQRAIAQGRMVLRHDSTILDTISDTFVIRLPMPTNRMTFIHEECIAPSVQAGSKLFWRDAQGPGPVKGSDAPSRVYEGYAALRFELKKVERIKDFYNVKEGQVVLVLRVVQLFDPVGPDRVPFSLPEGGDFVQGEVAGRYWCMPLDRALKYGILTPSSLKILEELYLGDSASTKSAAMGSSP
ncbi:hypothetical protein DFP72DRAFT_513572 [Ephemerocybe angulata]|uniref:Uncharacterized protein n=1 Tax=Ephemerocybe angulata TaxID=980116 RepID=A0A8H6M306_9AGAR|nr:hypothetical protein DFP72DRAFT_513572 [Tulosesus angulatus]